MEPSKQQLEKEVSMIISDVSCADVLSSHLSWKVKTTVTLITLTAGQYIISAAFVLTFENASNALLIAFCCTLLAAVTLVQRMNRYVEVYFMISEAVRNTSRFVSQIKRKMLDFICSYLLLSTLLVTVALFMPALCYFFPVVIIGACVMLDKIIGNELSKYNVGISVSRAFSVYRHGTPSLSDNK